MSFLFLLSIHQAAFAADSKPSQENTNSALNDNVISIVADEWCPYNCAPDAKNPGIIIEIAKLAFAKVGKEIKYEIRPWTRAIDETRAGIHHAIVGASIDDAPDFIFPEIHQAEMLNHFYVKNDNDWKFAGIDSLYKISLGVIKGYSYKDELDSYIEKYSSDNTRIQFSSGEDALETNFKKLVTGRISVLIEDKNVVENFLMEHPEFANQIKSAGILEEIDTNRLFIAFSPANPKSKEFAKIITEETKRLIESGELEKIKNKYINSDNNTTPVPETQSKNDNK